MIRYGDLQLIENGDDYLIIACDSAGGIGNKPGDTINVDPETSGYYCGLVPLMEILCARGEVISIVDTLSVEMEPTGQRIIKGIKQLMESLGIDRDLLTGSTEENVESSMTGIGVTVLGRISKSRHEAKKLTKDHIMVLIGYPKVGEEFLKDEIKKGLHECVKASDVVLIKDVEIIHDMIPVGSKGIAYECEVLASRHGLAFVETDHPIDMKKSAGPGTCILGGLLPGDLETLLTHISPLPVTKIGGFI